MNVEIARKTAEWITAVDDSVTVVVVSGGDAEPYKFPQKDGVRYRITVEELSEPEQPQWWWWKSTSGWERDCRQDDESCGVGGSDGGYRSCRVHGTTVDRDAKRNALLEAARKAGKS